MRLSVATAALVLALMSLAGEARAVHYGDIWPWCLLSGGGRDGGATNCGFESQAQCMASRTGNTDMCTPNALFDPSRYGPRARTIKRERKG